ncbi:MAG: sensor histidine kinase [Ignavibacteriales bacterium]
MRLFRPSRSPYLRIILVPGVMLTLLVGALVATILRDIHHDYETGSAVQASEIKRIATATHINQEAAAIQRVVGTTLERAAAGQLDEGDTYRIHVEVVNRLAALKRQLPALRNTDGTDAEEREAHIDFDAYRNYIITATDLAAINPSQAARYSYQAANNYVALSEHTHAVAESVALSAIRRSNAQAEEFGGTATLTLISGSGIIGCLLLLWFLATRRLVHHLSSLATTLEDLAAGQVDPPSLPEVVSLASRPHNVLTSLAAAVVAFRDEIINRQKAEEDLREKNIALEHSNSELESFAWVASHDLREPLRNITTFTTVLARRLDGKLEPDDEDYLRIVSDAATRMNALVLDLLEFSRVGRSQCPMEAVPLTQAFATAQEVLQLEIRACHATIEMPPNLPTVRGNVIELSRVFLNLLANALKYRSNAPPTIAITCTRDSDAVWRLNIQDNGIGIEPGRDYEERIFGLFQRLHQRDEYGGGTGIGLPICRKIITRHGGSIWAESDGPGKGTKFILTFPALFADRQEGLAASEAFGNQKPRIDVGRSK